MDIHIKPVEKFQLVQKKSVKLKDIAEVTTLNIADKQKLEQLEVFSISEDVDATYLVSIIDIITVIQRNYKNATISNVGESDTLIEYHKKPRKQNKFMDFLKVTAVSIILFAGAVTSIMCFQTDGQLSAIFENYYTIFTGKEEELPILFTLPYSIGLGVGVCVFFNHFGKIKVTDDPTPIEIEMTTYEKDTNASVIDCLNKRKNEEG